MTSTVGIPVIDTHAHVWDLDAPWMRWLDGRPATWDPVRRAVTWQDLRSELDAARVADVVLVQAGAAVQETRQLLDLAAREPSVLGVVGWVSMTSGRETEADLERLAGAGDDGLVGIRALHRWRPEDDLAAPGTLDSCAVLADRGLPLDVFVNHHTELPLALQLAERVPRLVLDHLGRPPLDDPGAFGGWAATMTELSRLPNVFVKYSGWATVTGRARAEDVRPFVDHVLAAFGASRVMYAGNWPVALVAADYASTYAATLDAISELSAEDLANVLYRTAEACYGLRRGDSTGAPSGAPAREEQH